MLGRLPLYIILLLFLLEAGCKRSSDNLESQTTIRVSQDSSHIDSFPIIDTSTKTVKYQAEEFYGDTIFVYSYGVQSWADSVSTDGYNASFSVWVDTTDYIIDTVKSSRGSRIVIGYNHHYHIEFRKNNKYWFSLNFDKKRELADLLSSTDSWIESNLDVFNNLLYNEIQNCFIIEFNISTRDNISSLYYIIFNTEGKIEYIGTANSWGGGGANGDSFLTSDGKLYVSCSEVYNFVTGTAMNLTEYASISEYQSESNRVGEFIQTHGIRQLQNSLFLVVFNRYHSKPHLNALILNTDSLIIERFKYYGLIEDMDANLLYQGIQGIAKSFLFDSEREVLIVIDQLNGRIEKEIAIDKMLDLDNDSLLSDTYTRIDFGFYASSFFYYSDKDSVVYISSYETD